MSRYGQYAWQMGIDDGRIGPVQHSVGSDSVANIGRYVVVERLGKGAMGTVFLARDPQLDRLVAIKVLSVERDNDELRQRFSHEARSAARLRHPNIVTVFDVGEDRGQPFIAMEYVNGESIAEIIRRLAPLALVRKIALIEGLCAGLSYAHKSGLVHRDIKPANLMVTAEGELKILDFGLARLTGIGDPALTQMGTVLGTPQYMSPEQIQGRTADQRSDIFSAGLVMYELLAYRKAFDGDTVIGVIQKIISTDAAPIRESLPEIDPEIERIVATAIAKDPNRRYQHADLILRDLDRVKVRLLDRADAATPLSDAVPSRSTPTPSSRTDYEVLRRRRAYQIEKWLQKAQTHFDASEFELAIVACESVLVLDPEEKVAVALLDRAHDALEGRQVAEWIANANAEVSRGNLADAAQLLEQVLQVRPGMSEAVELAQLLDRRTAESRQTLERDAIVRRAIELAKASFADGALEAAHRAASEALAFDDTNEQALSLKKQIAEALAARRQQAAELEGAPRGAETIVPPRSEPEAAIAPLEGTMFIPAAAGDIYNRPSGRLIVLQSVDAGIVNESFEVRDAFEIGREGRDFRSADLTWSRRHALIEYKDRGYTIRDLASSAGTFLNGRRLRADVPEPLFYGALISIGRTVLTFSPSSDTKLPDLTGLEVAGRYVLERLIRTSSKGAIYAARQKALPIRHAVKLLAPHLLVYTGYVDRFKREAEVATELHHPHICDVQDYGETTLVQPGKPPINTVYLCLRLMDGGSLADRLDGSETIPLADVSRWIDKVGDALAYAHSRNVVHGDIKPAAIVFDGASTANPYLSDFAIGQPRAGDSSPGVIGTPAYMAPEQWEGAPSTSATDQFGLAALAYLMVTGVRPFEGQDHPEIRRRNFARGPLPAHQEAQQHGREGVRPIVSHVLAQGLAVKPEARYPDIASFAQAFSGAITGARQDRDAAANPRVFLSYQRAGGAGLPLLIVTHLRNKHGIDVFIDVQRIDGAVKFPERLTREMEESDVFVCLLGPTTLESRWVRHEIRLAREHRKPMIPVFHEDYALPTEAGSVEVDELLSFDGIRLMDLQNLYVEEGIDKLARRIKNTVTRQIEE